MSFANPSCAQGPPEAAPFHPPFLSVPSWHIMATPSQAQMPPHEFFLDTGLWQRDKQQGRAVTFVPSIRASVDTWPTAPGNTKGTVDAKQFIKLAR